MMIIGQGSWKASWWTKMSSPQKQTCTPTYQMHTHTFIHTYLCAHENILTLVTSRLHLEVCVERVALWRVVWTCSRCSSTILSHPEFQGPWNWSGTLWKENMSNSYICSHGLQPIGLPNLAKMGVANYQS